MLSGKSRARNQTNCSPRYVNNMWKELPRNLQRHESAHFWRSFPSAMEILITEPLTQKPHWRDRKCQDYRREPFFVSGWKIGNWIRLLLLWNLKPYLKDKDAEYVALHFCKSYFSNEDAVSYWWESLRFRSVKIWNELRLEGRKPQKQSGFPPQW